MYLRELIEVGGFWKRRHGEEKTVWGKVEEDEVEREMSFFFRISILKNDFSSNQTGH